MNTVLHQLPHVGRSTHAQAEAKDLFKMASLPVLVAQLRL